MSKSKKLRLVSLLAIIAVVATVGISLAYWASGVGAPSDATGNTSVTIGEAGSVTTTINLSSFTKDVDGKLVPVFLSNAESYNTISAAATGAAAITAKGTLANPDKYKATGDVTYVQYSVDVTWELDDLTTGITDADGTLAVTYTSSAVTSPNYDTTALFIVKIDYTAAISSASANTVVITIFMKEPADAAEYAKVADKEIGFVFNFAITDPTPAV